MRIEKRDKQIKVSRLLDFSTFWKMNSKTKHNILKIGHRGAKAYVAENTIASIKKALNFNIDGVEVDVHVCASGELVVFHDFTLERMTNGTGEISKVSLTELKQLKIDNQYAIPTLTEVLDEIGNNYIINIELKGKNTAIPTCKLIDDYIHNKNWSYRNFLVSSFQFQELEQVFVTNKNIPLAVLTKANVDEAIVFAKTVTAIAIHPNIALLTSENVRQAHYQGFKVNTWTVNDKAAINRVKRYGVDGIISDYPDRL
ncbi:MAG: glycerophosphodiester phosphodiesterase [Aestuariibaculum sp.]